MDDFEFDIIDLPGLTPTSSISSNSTGVTPRSYTPPSLDYISPIQNTQFNTTLVQSLDLQNTSFQPFAPQIITLNPNPSPALLKEIDPYDIFPVPGIPNDYYSNIVCWSSQGKFLLIANHDIIYKWHKNSIPEPLYINWDFYSHPIETPISNLAISKQLVGFSRSSYLCIYDIEAGKLVARFLHKRMISCIVFSPINDQSTSNIFFGDEKGKIYRLIIEILDGKFYISEQGVLESHTSQICGITISPEGNYLAAGENHNKFSIWDIEKLDSPKLLHTRTHNAAIKALSFCPWSPILATGGGANDKMIKFWHIKTGILIKSYKTSGQITSLIWSKYSHKIVATFGFGSIHIAIVYSFPDCSPIACVKKYHSHCRAISAVRIDNTTVCIESVRTIKNDDNVTFNDGYLQFCKVWTSKGSKLPIFRNFGDDLIDMAECKDCLGEVIR